MFFRKVTVNSMIFWKYITVGYFWAFIHFSYSSKYTLIQVLFGIPTIESPWFPFASWFLMLIFLTSFSNNFNRCGQHYRVSQIATKLYLEQ